MNGGGVVIVPQMQEKVVPRVLTEQVTHFKVELIISWECNVMMQLVSNVGLLKK